MSDELSKWMWKYGDGWEFADPEGLVPQSLTVLKDSCGRWFCGEVGPAGFPDDDELRTRVIACLAAELEELKRGEYICSKCGLRKDGEVDDEPGF